MARSLRTSHRLGLLLAPLLGAGLLTCSESFECGGSSVAFVLPRPGDELVLRAFVCVEPEEDASWTIWASFEGEGLQSTELVLEVEDPVEGALQDTAVFDSELGFTLEAILDGSFDPAHCDEGFRVVLRREGEADTGVAAGWLNAYAEEVEPSSCTSRWQRSDEP